MDSPTDDALEAVVATLAAEVGLLRARADRKDDELAVLHRRVDQLERRHSRGPRDQADVDVFRALGDVLGGRPFTARAVVRHARRDARLHQALQAADLDSPRTIGKLLARCRYWTVAGWRIEDGPATRAGLLWHLVRV